MENPDYSVRDIIRASIPLVEAAVLGRVKARIIAAENPYPQGNTIVNGKNRAFEAGRLAALASLGKDGE